MSHPRITYDGVPLIITGKRMYDCHQGTDRHAADQQRIKKCKGDKQMLETVSFFHQESALPSCKNATTSI